MVPHHPSYLWTKIRQKIITGHHIPQHRQTKTASFHRASHQRVQRYSQLWRAPCKDLTICPGRALNDLYRSPEGSLGEVLKAVSETEVETCCMRRPRSVGQSVYPVGPGKKQVEGTLKNHSSSKWRQTNDSKVPMGICHGAYVDHTLVPPEISKPYMETWGKKTSFNDSATSNKTYNRPSSLDLALRRY